MVTKILTADINLLFIFSIVHYTLSPKFIETVLCRLNLHKRAKNRALCVASFFPPSLLTGAIVFYYLKQTIQHCFG